MESRRLQKQTGPFRDNRCQSAPAHRKRSSRNRRAICRNVAGEKRDCACRGIHAEARTFFNFIFGYCNAHALRHRLCDRPPIGQMERAVGFAELKRLFQTVADANDLIGRRYRCARYSRRMVEPVSPAEAVKTPSPFLKECKYLRECPESLDAVAGIVTPARVGPARITLFGPRTEHDDIGTTLWPASAFKRDVERKEHLMKSCHRFKIRVGLAQQRGRSDL